MYQQIFRWGLIFFLCTILFPTNSLWAQVKNEVNIYGKLSVPSGKELIIHIFETALSGSPEIQRINLKNNNEFTWKYSLESPREVIIYTTIHPQEGISLFVEPGDSLQIEWNPQDNPLKSLSLAGIGAEENLCLQEYFTEFHELQENVPYPLHFKNDKEAEFLEYLDQLEKKKLKFLDQIQKKRSLSVRFLQYLRHKIIYERACDVMNYPRYHIYLNRKETHFSVSEAYFKHIEHLVSADETALESREYLEFLSMWVKMKSSPRGGMTPMMVYPQHYLVYINTARELLSGKALSAVLASLIVEGLQMGGIGTLGTEAQGFIKNMEHPHLYREFVSREWEIRNRLRVGKEVMDVRLETVDGKAIGLKEFRSKVVYMIFWKDDCLPCMEELQAADALLTDLQTDQVVFLFISMDPSRSHWLKNVSELKTGGIHLRAGDLSNSPARMLGIHELPECILLRKNGTIAYTPSKRPTEKGIEDDLLRLMEE